MIADLVEEVVLGDEPFVERVGDVTFLHRRASRSSLYHFHQLLLLRFQLLRLQPQRVELVARSAILNEWRRVGRTGRGSPSAVT